MSRKVLVFEPERCIGCRLCEGWCSITHDGVVNPARSRIRIIRNHAKQVDVAIYCHQCDNAPCIAACSFDALTRDEKTGAILVDSEKCAGCRACIHACPYAAPSMHPTEEFVLICDLCEGNPQCVLHCPEGAIQYLERHKAHRLHRSRIVRDIAGEKG